jgi:transposase
MQRVLWSSAAISLDYGTLQLRHPAIANRMKLDTYPSIAKRAKQQGAEIYFWDESGFRGDALQGTTWSPKEETPVVAMPGKRQSISAPSAVNAKGGFWFATYHGAISAELFIEMLKILMNGRRRPLFLILDSLPAHRAKIVSDYVASTNGKLQFFFLPGYAPELNPDELDYMKRTGTGKRPLAKGESLHDRIDAELLELQRNSALVCSFFKAKSVSYITD